MEGRVGFLWRAIWGPLGRLFLDQEREVAHGDFLRFGRALYPLGTRYRPDGMFFKRLLLWKRGGTPPGDFRYDPWVGFSRRRRLLTPPTDPVVGALWRFGLV